MTTGARSASVNLLGYRKFLHISPLNLNISGVRCFSFLHFSSRDIFVFSWPLLFHITEAKFQHELLHFMNYYLNFLYFKPLGYSQNNLINYFSLSLVLKLHTMKSLQVLARWFELGLNLPDSLLLYR